KETGGVLARDGALVLQVTLLDNVDEYESRGEGAKLFRPVHNFYFSEATLVALFRRAGLSPQWKVAEEDLSFTAFCRADLDRDNAYVGELEHDVRFLR